MGPMKPVPTAAGASQETDLPGVGEGQTGNLLRPGGVDPDHSPGTPFTLAFYKCPLPRSQFPKKEERAPGPYSNPATLSPEENPNGHPLHLTVPRIFQPALIATDSRTYKDPNNNPPPRPAAAPPPTQAGGLLLRPGNAPWGKVKGAFRIRRLGHSRPPLSSRTERIGLPRTTAPQPANPTRFPQQRGLRDNRAHSPSQQHRLRDRPAGSAAQGLVPPVRGRGLQGCGPEEWDCKNN